ncbi:hypothetical protein [Arenibacter certesii]|uniref:Uncharacterized protein n=2 Tax=Arenibacter certesii TaxID=228955 RepID=A0A918IPV3_9FLAO|nr:hypothetical protein [Arenibacter certesii]GGW23363.1 hypothetical protein GCM10007383_04390 [Arenibacter certesii]
MTLVSLNAQHIAPKSIKDEVATALSYYPELADTPVTVKFKKNIRKSTMMAQPNFWSLFGSRKNRKYLILISEKFKISGKEFHTKSIDPKIMIGWIGHELGHIMDYKDRSNLNLFWFGIKYFLSGSYIIEAERAADTYAVSHGMGTYILGTKNFILDHAEIRQDYKDRIKKYYLSPEEIMVLVEQMEDK